MARGWRLEEWNGDEIARKVRAAEVEAVQETIDAAAATAAGMRTGSHSDITSEAAEETSTGATGRWGNFPEPGGDPFHELFRETGTAYLPGDNAKRRAADQEYANLADRIRNSYGG